MKAFFRAAFVIARRDFTAVIFGRTFILFLIGPIVMVGFASLASKIGNGVTAANAHPSIAVALSPAEADRLRAATDRLADHLGADDVPGLKSAPPGRDPAALLADSRLGVLAVLSGTLDQPVLTGKPDQLNRLQGTVMLMVDTARAGGNLPDIAMVRHEVKTSVRAEQTGQLETARYAQLALFLFNMLLAGMVLSNLVEEKGNKIIEILAAAIPVDAIFFGKLMAMLGMSLVGIACWGGLAMAANVALTGHLNPGLPEPAIGWPLFVGLTILYFALAYTLLGALFLGIGAQAATVREVQTLSMPVTMSQPLFFFLASWAVARQGQWPEFLAVAFPFSSPFAMVARAAQVPSLWPHLLAILWQILWVAIIVRIGVRMFRRTVFQSSGGRRSKRVAEVVAEARL